MLYLYILYCNNTSLPKDPNLKSVCVPCVFVGVGAHASCMRAYLHRCVCVCVCCLLMTYFGRVCMCELVIVVYIHIYVCVYVCVCVCVDGWGGGGGVFCS